MEVNLLYFCIISIILCTVSNAEDDDDGMKDPPDEHEVTVEAPDENNVTESIERPRPPTENQTIGAGYTKHTFREQQKILVQVITRLNLDPSSNLQEPSTHMFKILRKCSEIYKKNVNNDLVLHKIIDNALTAFQLLFEGLDTRPLASEVFSDIMNTLSTCDSDGKQFQFRVSSCPPEIEKIVTEENGTTTVHTPIIPYSRKFLEYENDLITEVNWKIFDFCHSRCFQHFSPQFNSHHHMAHSMEKLFEQGDIQERWFRSTGGLNYLKGIITASNMMLRIKNLDFSVVAAHLNSNYKVWLVKPGLSKLIPLHHL